MKKSYLLLFTAFLFSCGGGQSKVDQLKEKYSVEPADPYTKWETNYGIGPITSFELPADVDSELAEQGLKVFEAKCTACHKPDKKFIGPPPQGILTRRTPSWVMNMILNPEEMLQKDPIAKKLFMEFNGSPMANQNLTKEEARAVLEYFRTL
ncbi:MAG TPA: cytochrome c [Cyclobacteriaceae bacterium]